MTYVFKQRCPVLGAVTVDELGAITIYPSGDELGISRSTLASIVDALAKAGFKARDVHEGRNLRRQPNTNARHERQAEI